MKLAHKNVCVHVGVGVRVHKLKHMEMVKSIYLSIYPTMAFVYNMHAHICNNTIKYSLLPT